MRLIDAVWLEEKLKESLDVIANDMSDAVLSDDEEVILAAKNQYSAYATALTLLNHAPTIEAAPVVHGEWIKSDLLFGADECTNCHASIYNTSGMNFCPNCGADMRKGGA